jgi:hypothetical protein
VKRQAEKRAGKSGKEKRRLANGGEPIAVKQTFQMSLFMCGVNIF